MFDAPLCPLLIVPVGNYTIYSLFGATLQANSESDLKVSPGHMSDRGSGIQLEGENCPVVIFRYHEYQGPQIPDVMSHEWSPLLLAWADRVAGGLIDTVDPVRVLMQPVD